LLNPPFVDEPAYGERLIARSLRRVLFARPKEIAGPVYLLRHVWERHIYHLLFDLLPQLSLAERAGVRRVLVGERLYRDRRFRRLVLHNPRFTSLEVMASDEVVIADRPFLGHAGWPTPATARWVADRVAPDAAGPDRRILILRRPGDGRSVANLHELEPVAERHRLEMITLEDHSFDRQVEIFAAARVVIGVHGAGLANVVFRGRRPLTVVELVPGAIRHPFYFNLVPCLGAEYRGLPVSSLPTGRTFREHDVSVDPSLFDAALDSLP
jgi:capsular polysaccharide biosynthesis protein